MAEKKLPESEAAEGKMPEKAAAVDEAEKKGDAAEAEPDPQVRLKYPHVAIGTVASSAPILQFDYITPWSSFYDAVSQDYKSESLNCFSVIKETWDVVDERGASDKGLLELTGFLYYNYTGDLTCNPIEDEDDPHGLGGWQWQKVDKVRRRFGSNIIFSNGMRDSRGGVLKNISSSIIALVTEKACP
nr:unnamed protein product [Digitaria exilis]